MLEQVDRLCTHLTVLKNGAVVGSGSMQEMHAGFGGVGLEAGFMQMTEQVDADAIATNIVAAAARVGRSAAGRGEPFGRLVGHFLDARWFAAGRTTRRRSWNSARARLLGLLAAPGAFTCLLLLDKYSAFLNWMRGRLCARTSDVTSIPDKYLFLTVAMAVAGIVTVLKWDQILPDSQDYLNLAPLPVRPPAHSAGQRRRDTDGGAGGGDRGECDPDGAVPDVRDGGGTRRRSLRSCNLWPRTRFPSPWPACFRFARLSPSWAGSPRSCRAIPFAHAPPGCAG